MQAAPFGAQCALHATVNATLVCARCGNFMCDACAVGGSETQCPTCRTLNAHAFPYDANASFDALWNHSTAAFQRELAMCVVATVIFFALAMGGGIISSVVNSIVGAILGVGMGSMDEKNPLSNLPLYALSLGIGQITGAVINMAVQGVALVGLYRVLIDVLVGKKADVARMFSQLHLFVHYVALQLIIFFALTIPALVGFGGLALVALKVVGFNWKHPEDFNAERLLNPAFLGLFLLMFVTIIVASIALMPVTLFSVPELVVGQCGPIEAIKRSWNLGSGQRLRIFGYSFVAGLVTLAGALACGVGLLAAMPLAYLLLLSLFLALRNSAGLPPATHA